MPKYELPDYADSRHPIDASMAFIARSFAYVLKRPGLLLYLRYPLIAGIGAVGSMLTGNIMFVGVAVGLISLDVRNHLIPWAIGKGIDAIFPSRYKR